MVRTKKAIGTIAFISGGGLHYEDFLYSWSDMITYNHEYLVGGYGEGATIYRYKPTGPTTDKFAARNDIAKSMLGAWVFMTDTDHSFDPDILCRLLSIMDQYESEDGQPIQVLTGVYRYKQYPYLPVLYHFDAASQKHQVIATLNWDAAVQAIGKDGTGCAGAGCLLVRRAVFDRIREELRVEPFDPTAPFVTSEDFSFFAKLRQLGIRVHVAPQVESRHLIVKGVTREDFDQEAIEAMQ